MYKRQGGGDNENVEEEMEICFYKYDHGSSFLEWTGFKTNAKVGVKGSFNEMEYTGGETTDDPKLLIQSIKMTMSTASVETNDEGRNKKIAEQYFGVMTDTETIEAQFVKLSDDGKATLSITLNGVTSNVVGDYTLDGGSFDFKATMDVGKWDALSAVASLNEVCKEKHTGDDGVSKTWAEVDLSFSTQLTSDCD